LLVLSPAKLRCELHADSSCSPLARTFLQLDDGGGARTQVRLLGSRILAEAGMTSRDVLSKRVQRLLSGV